MTARNARLRATLILASGCAALLAVGLDVATPVRAAVIFWFVCVCPGLAWITLLRLREPLAEFVLGVALSLVAATLASEALVLLRLWSAPAVLVCLALAAVPPCVHTLIRPASVAADSA